VAEALGCFVARGVGGCSERWMVERTRAWMDAKSGCIGTTSGGTNCTLVTF
jgi:hypothetical protein